MIKKLISVLQVASAFIGTIVGAGFASGKEIIQFFTQYQINGTLGAIFSGVLMTWAGTKMMIYARRIGAYSFNELVIHIFGERLGTAIQALVFFVILGITGVMLAGAGAVFQEQLDWHRQIGIVLALVVSFLFLLKGIRGLLWINTLVVPMLAAFVLTVFLGRGAAPDAVWLTGNIKWLPAALSYASFNMLTALVVLVPLAKETEDETVLWLGGLLGGAGLGLILILAHFLLLGAPESAGFEMPMADIVRHFGPLIHIGFVAVIFGEILTTFIGNIFGLARQLRSTFPLIPNMRAAIFILFIGAFLISQAGYGSLIRTLYPLFGVLCVAIVLCMLWIRLPKRGNGGD
ncbi:YkvI family membrane protein [Sporolactobacillus putidus]|uniref:Membrane protein n=1 Tax=Sporolactobacillus putidus TaxID=492735 RepID=A0A917S5B5_9BACL|nr:transporter [Sporolactobacillus putidus]GGL59116.1 membrane protein [Sporolactobacillus putidus]